jgi:hypothetical protein
MEKFLKIVVNVLTFGVHAFVRVSRAADAAVWEIWPEAYAFLRDTSNAAHKRLCDDQAATFPAAPEKKKPKPAVKPIAELPSSFPSFEARTSAADKLRARWETAKSEYGSLEFGTPEWEAGKDKADDIFAALMRSYDTPVRY